MATPCKAPRAMGQSLPWEAHACLPAAEGYISEGLTWLKQRAVTVREEEEKKAGERCYILSEASSVLMLVIEGVSAPSRSVPMSA